MTTLDHAARRRLARATTAIAGASVSLIELLQVATDQARDLVEAHQAATSLTIEHDWARSINVVSLSDKYARYRGYEAQPDGSGIYTLVCRENRPMRMTQAELEAHPAWRRFGAESGRHPPMRGWLAAPLVGRDGANLGLIQLSDKDDGEFTETDEALLAELAGATSRAIERYRPALTRWQRRARSG